MLIFKKGAYMQEIILKKHLNALKSSGLLKFLAFTMTEVMIVMTILGVIATIMITTI